MAKAMVVHSDDAATIIFNGDKRRPEPSSGIIKFPGGHVEVTRCSDGSYWAHLAVVSGVNIIDSRMDYSHDADVPRCVTDMPEGQKITKLALRISNAVPHFDPDL
jgi:hypothetical protein